MIKEQDSIRTPVEESQWDITVGQRSFGKGSVCTERRDVVLSREDVSGETGQSLCAKAQMSGQVSQL
jgi:hypothetical protein